TKARPRPSAPTARRMMMGPSESSPRSRSRARTGWSSPRSNAAVTTACSVPWRTSLASPRAPSARPSASSRIDLPAPVSPVSAEKPGSSARSSWSIRTTSRIERRASMAGSHGGAEARQCGESSLRLVPHSAPSAAPPGLEQPVDRAPHEGALAVRPRRALDRFLLHQLVGVEIPFAGGIIVAEYGGDAARLVGEAERGVALGHAVQRLGHLAAGLKLLNHDFVAVDRGEVTALPLIP